MKFVFHFSMHKDSVLLERVCITQQLISRLRELADRYDRPLSRMVERVSELEAKVYGHLERMGFAWL